MTEILSGKQTSAAIKSWVTDSVTEIKNKYGWTPSLATVRIGENEAAECYIRSQLKACEKAGIDGKLITFPEDIEKEEFLKEVKKIADDPEIDGIIIETPLPKGWRAEEVLSVIPPIKDVEGIHPENLGRLYLGEKGIPMPCTAAASVALLEWYGYTNFTHKNCVVLGRSATVGRAVTLMLMHRNGTVTMCHTKTSDEHKRGLLAEADFVVVAAGMPGVVSTADLKPGAIVIDVATNVTEEGKLVGDLVFDPEHEIAAVSPVPGGVGPVTVAVLLSNLLLCATRRRLKETMLLPGLEAVRESYGFSK